MKTTLIRLLILLLVPMALAGADALVRPTSGSSTARPDTAVEPANQQPNGETSVDEITRILDLYNEGAIFIDARPRDYYVAGHIPGAFNLALQDFFSGRPDVLDFIPEHIPLVIYCEGGDCDSSHKVSEMLGEFGYTKMTLFHAGYPAWVEAELPVETGEMDLAL